MITFQIIGASADVRRIFSFSIFCLVSLMLLPDLQAQAGARVLTAKKRKEVLETGMQAINQKDPVFRAELSSLTYPFAFKEEVRPVVRDAPVVEEKPVEIVFSDREILEAVAPNVRPTGTLVRGNQRILVFQGGQVPEGGSIGVNFRGTPYTILVKNITERGYQLILNEEIMQRTFGQASEGVIRRDPSQP